MSGAGLKKCSPRQRSGRALPAAIAVTEIAEVLVASTARSPQMPSSAAKSSRLARDLLDDRLDHELAAREPVEVGHERQPLERGAPLLVAALPLLDAPREPALDARPRALERGVVDVAADDLAAALEQHLGDARPHRAEADDAHACDRFHARER